MYSWTDDTADWYRPGSYLFDPAKKDARKAESERAAAAGPRAYGSRHAPNQALIDPRKHLESDAPDVVVIGVDVTGSMANWPFEIFDRLPLFYNTLSSYRDGLEVCFAAIGDAGVDRWPLQVTGFARGYDLEQQLQALFGEGGGGDAPESYGLFAYWVRHHVKTPKCKRPFLIVFGDAPMHPKVPARQVRQLLGDAGKGEIDALAEWQALARDWSTWFLRRPTGRKGDEVDQQWKKAVGDRKVVHMQNEARAVDYAMGIVARTWGHFEDFKRNMAARQPDDEVAALERGLDAVHVRALSCPRCAAPVPPSAHGRFTCSYCSATLQV